MSTTTRPFRIRHAVVAIGLFAATGFPLAHVAAAPLAGGGFTTTANASPGAVPRGSTTTISVPVTSGAPRTALVDVEVYDSAGRKVLQRYWDGQSFSANVARTYTTSWAVPSGQATGTYRVDVGVFASGWSQLYHWNRGATSVTVS